MKGNGKELSAKINEIIKEEITGLSLPLTTTHSTKISIVIADGYTNVNGKDIRITIKLNKQGYWIDIGGLIKMAKTVEQLNKIIDINAQIQSTNDERNSFIEKLRKSGLEEIKSVQPTEENQVSSPPQAWPSKITGFKIDDTKSIWVVDWLKTSSPLCNKIVGFSNNATSCYNYFKPEHFKKELEEFLSKI